MNIANLAYKLLLPFQKLKLAFLPSFPKLYCYDSFFFAEKYRHQIILYMHHESLRRYCGKVNSGLVLTTL